MDAPRETPQKYIRTFAGDMNAVQKGIVPNLMPLESGDPVRIHQPETASLPASTILPPTSTGHLSVPIARNPLFDQLPTPQKADLRPSPLQTYSSDFSAQIKKSNASTATILAAEQDARGAPVVTTDMPSRGGMLYIAGGVLLLLVGIGGAYYTYSQYLIKSTPVVITPVVVSAPIFVDQSEEISGTGTVLLQAVIKSLARPLERDTIRFLYRPLITGADDSVFIALQLPAPDMLLRNINTQGSMAGVVGSSPFFILSVASYTDTFAAMLAWEPRMARDLGTLFIPAPLAAPLIAPPTATTTATAVATSTPAAIPVFHDEVIANHDARVYRNAAGSEQIVYGYWNQHALVIARDSRSFAEIIGRLATSRKQ